MILIKVIAVFIAVKICHSASTPADPTSDIRKTCFNVYNQTQKGNFSSTNFELGLPYPVKSICGWLIQSPESVADITISFDYFDIVDKKRCSHYDYMEIYKQLKGQKEWSKISSNEGYCGKKPPFNVTTKAKKVLVKFISDELKPNKRGFNASFLIKITQMKPAISCVGKVGVSPCNATISAIEKEVLTIQCYKNGLPNPSVMWRKMNNDTDTVGMDLRKGLVKTVITNGSIQLHNIEMSDKGKYMCFAQNKLGVVKYPFRIVVTEKCLCPKKIKIMWYKYPPYTRYEDYDNQNNIIYKGILYAVLKDMISEVCGECKMGYGKSELVWNHGRPSKNKLSDVKTGILDGSSDIYLPIEGGQDDIRYRSSYYFLPIIDSPGVAFIVIGEEEGSASQAIFNSIIGGWPILVLTVVMAFLSGIIIWMLDTYWNEDQFPRSFHEGIAEGFWWAFVTMTTVGYGDIAPLGVPGRIFAIFWILTGLVIIAIFTSVVTTSLTVVTMSTNKKLYGSLVGAIDDSSEYRMGAIKNAEMKNYSTFDELKKNMDERKIIGSLIDSYVAAHYEKFDTFRVNNIFASNKAYGIVLGKSMSTKEIYNKMKQWVEANKADITKKIEQNAKTLKEPGGSAAMEKSSELFNPNSPIFKKSIIGTSIILAVLVIGGLLFEYGYLRPRHRMIEAAKNLEMVESHEVKEMAYRAKCLKEILLSQVAEFYERWNDRLHKLTVKHKAEQNKMLEKGKAAEPQPTAPPQSPSDEVGLDGPDAIDKPTESYTTSSGL